MTNKKMSMMRRVLLGTMMGIGMYSAGYTQIQVGGDIDGIAAEDYSGTSVSMPDANTIAMGAPGNGPGHVRIFSWNGTSWAQKGANINGEASNDVFGRSVSMPDANTIAIGGPSNTGGGSMSKGHVRVYQLNGTAWEQKGADIDGTMNAENFGITVSMPDANTVAVGAPFSTSSSFLGKVTVYTWNGSAWVAKGSIIFGDNTGDLFGWAVSMPDANTIAIGAPNNDFLPDGGQVKIFSWNGSDWIQKGAVLNGEASGDLFGYSLSMPDSNTIAVGAKDNDDNGVSSGHVRVFTWNGSSWIAKGLDIAGEAAEDYAGYSVSMADPNTVAIGAYGNDGNGTFSGHVRVYAWDGSAWAQAGTDIDGESANDMFGYAVSMPDANTVGAGAIGNDGVAFDAGQVRVYAFSTVGIQSKTNQFYASVYPNPTSGLLNVSFVQPVSAAVVTVTNALGQIISTVTMHGSTAAISLPDAAGLYQVRIEADGKTEFHVVNKL